MDAPLNKKIERTLKRKAARKKNDSNYMPVLSLREQVLALVSEANSKVPQERRVTPRSALIVMNRALSSLSSLDDVSLDFAVIKEVSRFLNVATKTFTASQTHNTDLLVAGHPLSTLNASLSGEEFLKKNARWIAADPSIDESIRPLVASAHAATPGSLEREHAFARLNASKTLLAAYFKIDNLSPIVAAFGSGNSSAARRARVALQWRDKKGRWVEMGRGANFRFRTSGGSVAAASGVYVGVSSPRPGAANQRPAGLIQVSGNKNLPDGIYAVQPGNVDTYAARISSEALKKAGITPGATPDQSVLGIPSRADIIATRQDAPTGWTKADDNTFTSDDNYTAKVTDGEYTLYRQNADGSLADKVGDAGNWADVNDLANGDQEAYDAVKGESLTEGQRDGQRAVKARLDTRTAYNAEFDRLEELVKSGVDQNGNKVPAGWEGVVRRGRMPDVERRAIGADRVFGEEGLPYVEYNKEIANDYASPVSVKAGYDFGGKFSAYDKEYPSWEAAEADIPRWIKAEEVKRDRKLEPIANIPSAKAGGKEIYERRMAGDSLDKVAKDLGIPREEVRRLEAEYGRTLEGNAPVSDDKSVDEINMDPPIDGAEKFSGSITQQIIKLQASRDPNAKIEGTLENGVKYSIYKKDGRGGLWGESGVIPDIVTVDLSGRTFDARQAIKQEMFRWDATDKVWRRTHLGLGPRAYSSPLAIQATLEKLNGGNKLAGKEAILPSAAELRQDMKANKWTPKILADRNGVSEEEIKAVLDGSDKPTGDGSGTGDGGDGGSGPDEPPTPPSGDGGDPEDPSSLWGSKNSIEKPDGKTFDIILAEMDEPWDDDKTIMQHVVDQANELGIHVGISPDNYGGGLGFGDERVVRFTFPEKTVSEELARKLIGDGPDSDEDGILMSRLSTQEDWDEALAEITAGGPDEPPTPPSGDGGDPEDPSSLWGSKNSIEKPDGKTFDIILAEMDEPWDDDKTIMQHVVDQANELGIHVGISPDNYGGGLGFGDERVVRFTFPEKTVSEELARKLIGDGPDSDEDGILMSRLSTQEDWDEALAEITAGGPDEPPTPPSGPGSNTPGSGFSDYVIDLASGNRSPANDLQEQLDEDAEKLAVGFIENIYEDAGDAYELSQDIKDNKPEGMSDKEFIDDAAAQMRENLEAIVDRAIEDRNDFVESGDEEPVDFDKEAFINTAIKRYKELVQEELDGIREDDDDGGDGDFDFDDDGDGDGDGLGFTETENVVDAIYDAGLISLKNRNDIMQKFSDIMQDEDRQIGFDDIESAVDDLYENDKISLEERNNIMSKATDAIQDEMPNADAGGPDEPPTPPSGGTPPSPGKPPAGMKLDFADPEQAAENAGLTKDTPFKDIVRAWFDQNIKPVAPTAKLDAIEEGGIMPSVSISADNEEDLLNAFRVYFGDEEATLEDLRDSSEEYSAPDTRAAVGKKYTVDFAMDQEDYGDIGLNPDEDYTSEEVANAWIKTKGLAGKVTFAGAVESNGMWPEMSFNIPDEHKDAFAEAYGYDSWKDLNEDAQLEEGDSPDEPLTPSDEQSQVDIAKKDSDLRPREGSSTGFDYNGGVMVWSSDSRTWMVRDGARDINLGRAATVEEAKRKIDDSRNEISSGTGDAPDEPPTPPSGGTPPKTPSPNVPSAPGLFNGFNVPDGAFKFNTVDYSPEGRIDEASSDFTDDPQKLAIRFTPQDLVQALSQAMLGNSTDAALAEILNANVDDDNDILDPAEIQDSVNIPQVNLGVPSGAGQLEFSAGAEFVPAEALFNAIWEAGLDPNRVVANIYDSVNGNNNNLNKLIDAQGGVPSAEEAQLVDDIVQEIRQLKDASAPGDSPVANEKQTPSPDPLPGSLIENIPIDFDNPDYYIPNTDAYVPSQPDVDENGYTDNPEILSADYEVADLIEQMLSGITDGSGAALLAFDNITVEVPIEAMRDAIQYQDINTNQILLDLKKESNDMGDTTPRLQAHSQIIADLVEQTGNTVDDDTADKIRDVINEKGLLDWSEADDAEIIEAITEVAGPGLFGEVPTPAAERRFPPTTGERQATETSEVAIDSPENETPQFNYPGPREAGYSANNTVLDSNGAAVGAGARVQALSDGRAGTILAVQNIDTKTGRDADYVRVRFDDGMTAVRSARQVFGIDAGASVTQGEGPGQLPPARRRAVPQDPTVRLNEPAPQGLPVIAGNGDIPGVNLVDTPQDLVEFTNPDAKQSDYLAWGLRAPEVARAGRERVTIDNIADLIAKIDVAKKAYSATNNADERAKIKLEYEQDDEKIETLLRDTFGVREGTTFGSRGYTVRKNATVSYGMYNSGEMYASIRFAILDNTGVEIGTGDRSLRGNNVENPDGTTSQEWYTTNSVLRIPDKNNQKSGFAAAYNRYMENWYIANGFKKVKVHAYAGAGWDGGLVWALNGFIWDGPSEAGRVPGILRKMLNDARTTEEEKQIIKNMQDKMAELNPTGNYTPDTVPTPLEIAQIGAYAGASEKAWWAGKRTMINLDWYGVKNLDPAATEQRQALNYNQIRNARKRIAGNVNRPNVSRELVLTTNSNEFADANPELRPYIDYIRDVFRSNRSLAVLSPGAKTALNRFAASQLLKGEDRTVGLEDLIKLRVALDAEFKADNPLATSNDFGVGSQLLDVSMDDVRRNNVPGFTIRELGMYESGINSTFIVMHNDSGQVFYIKKDSYATQYQLNGPGAEVQADAMLRASGMAAGYETRVSSVDPEVLVMQRAGAGVPLLGEPMTAANALNTMSVSLPDGSTVRVNSQNFMDLLHTPEDAIRVMLVDLIISNTDRHNGNLLLAVDGTDAGKIRILPIDHALSAFSPGTERVQYTVNEIFDNGNDNLYGMAMPVLTKRLKQDELLALFRNEANAIVEGLNNPANLPTGRELDLIISNFGSLDAYRQKIQERIDSLLKPDGEGYQTFLSTLKPGYWTQR